MSRIADAKDCLERTTAAFRTAVERYADAAEAYEKARVLKAQAWDDLMVAEKAKTRAALVLETLEAV